MALIENLRKWRNGEVLNARDYVYERDLIISLLNEHETRLAALETLVDEVAGAATFLQSEQPTTTRAGDLWFEIV